MMGCSDEGDLDCADALERDCVRHVFEARERHALVAHRPAQREPAHPDRRDAARLEVVEPRVEQRVVRRVAGAMRATKERGERILWVGGPAVVHTGAGPSVVRLIEAGYMDVLFAGNALATHDIEGALYGTSLGVNLDEGTGVEHGIVVGARGCGLFVPGGTQRAHAPRGVGARGPRPASRLL